MQDKFIGYTNLYDAPRDGRLQGDPQVLSRISFLFNLLTSCNLYYTLYSLYCPINKVMVIYSKRNGPMIHIFIPIRHKNVNAIQLTRFAILFCGYRLPWQFQPQPIQITADVQTIRPFLLSCQLNMQHDDSQEMPNYGKTGFLVVKC